MLVITSRPGIHELAWAGDFNIIAEVAAVTVEELIHWHLARLTVLAPASCMIVAVKKLHRLAETGFVASRPCFPFRRRVTQLYPWGQLRVTIFVINKEARGK